MNQLLLASLLTAGSLLLLPRVRQEERLRARLQDIRSDGIVQAGDPEPSVPLLLRFVGFAGGWLSRSRFVQGSMAAGMWGHPVPGRLPQRARF